MDIHSFVKSKTFTGMLYGIGIMLLGLIIFQAGIFVGFRRAQFSEHFGNTYYRAFGTRDGGPNMFFSEGVPAGSGAAGTIVKIDLPRVIVEDADGTEKVVLLTSDTLIRRFRDEAMPSDLAVNDFIVALGSPNAQSQVEAKLIRILPPPPEGMMGGMMRASTTSRP